MPEHRARAPSLADWQSGAGRCSLQQVDPAAPPGACGGKEADPAAVERLAGEVDELQERLYADRRHARPVVLQGTGTSGKDGTARAVFARTRPEGGEHRARHAAQAEAPLPARPCSDRRDENPLHPPHQDQP